MDLSKYDQPEKNEPEIEVITKEDMEKTGGSAPPPPPKKSRISKKTIIIALVLLFIAIDIPIGWRLYQNYTARDEPEKQIAQNTQIQASTPPQTPPTQTPTAPISSPTPIPTEEALQPLPTEIAQNTIQTHSECFEGTCVEIEGAGVDQCSIDRDCLTSLDHSATESALSKPSTPPTTTSSPQEQIPVPDTPAAGNITQTLAAIVAGFFALLISLLIL